MKNQITILSAKNNRQVIELDGKKYEFEFSEKELANSIDNRSYSYELEEKSGLCHENYTFWSMALHIANKWNHEDVIILISDFINKNPNNLIDHLIA